MNKPSAFETNRVRRIAAICIALALLLTACGSSTDDTVSVDNSTDTGETASAQSDEAAATDESNDADDDHDDEDDHEHDDDGNHLASTGDDTLLFFDGALAEDVTTEACTLSGGTEAMCYRITVAGDPVSYDIGPFCPRNITDTAEAGGLWIDGNGAYDVDGEFIAGLADLYADDNWKLYNDDGTINVTDTAEEFDLAARPNVDPSLQNHCVEGRLEWLPNGEPISTTVLIPVEPVLAGGATASRGNLGVTLDGVVIAASAPVDAILGAYTIAAFDDCGGHYNPFDGYHLHGATGCSELGEAADGETAMFAYSLDGFPVHSPLDDPDSHGLDECNGHETEDGYHYHANNAAENLVLECFVGQTASAFGEADAGGRPERPAPGADEEAAAAPAGAAAEVQLVTNAATEAFHEGALTAAPGTVPCTLENGSATTCYQFQVASLASNVDTDGPFCPATSSDQGGIWVWDGDEPGLYSLNADFWAMMDAQGYEFVDADGNISVTNPGAGPVGGAGTANSCLEATPDGSFNLQILIPTAPERLDAPVYLGQVSQVGLAVDGVPIFGDAPSVADRGGLPALDACGGHIDPSGYYHWHFGAASIQVNLDDAAAAVMCSVASDLEGLLAFSYDGHPIYGPEENGAVPTDLDECSGHIGDTEEFGEIYHYHFTYESPNLPPCRIGAIATNALSSPDNANASLPGGSGGGRGRGDRPPRERPAAPADSEQPAAADGERPARGQGQGQGQGGGPDFAAAAAALGISEDAIRSALGGPPPDFPAAAATLGISVEELQAALAGEG